MDCPPNLNPPPAFVETMERSKNNKSFIQVGMVIFLADYDFAFEIAPNESIDAAILRGKKLALLSGHTPETHSKNVAKLVEKGYCVF